MAWKRSVTSAPRFRQLFEEPDALDFEHNPQAVDNLYELARLAAYKAFCLMGTWYETRRAYYEDAIQEAATILCEWAHRGARLAYAIAKHRLVIWIIRFLYGGKPRRPGQPMLLPPPPLSIDAFDEMPHWISEQVPLLTPEETLITQETASSREACIDAMFDVIYDLVAHCAGLQRGERPAMTDAMVFQHTLRGATWRQVAVEMGCAERTARQRIHFARRRLASYLEAHGVEQVAARYADPQAPMEKATEEWAFIKAIVEQRLAAHQQRTKRLPHRRTVQKWAAAARAEWRRNLADKD